MLLSVIQIEEIVQHIDGFSRPLVESRQIVKSHYLQKVGVLEENESCIRLRGLCLRVHNAHEILTINVTISKPFPGAVLYAHCTCTAGNLGKCKHAVAVLRCAKK